MLRLRGQVWWFRRKVPPALMPFLKTAEVAISLKTDSRRIAVARGHAVWLRVDEVFQMAKSPIARSQALVLLREMARAAPWEEHELRDVYSRARKGDYREFVDLIRHATDDITDLSREELARVMLHIKELNGRLEAFEKQTELDAIDTPLDANQKRTVRLNKFSRMTQEINLSEAIDAKQAETIEAPAPAVADFVEAFLSSKIVDGYTAGTAHQTRMTLRLWTEFIGEIPVRSVTGRHAGEFRDLLLKLPSSHGKSASKGKPVSGFDSIALADRKAEAGTPVARLSMKTAKRHFSTMQQLWKYLHQRSEVSGNPFAGYSFPGTKSKKSARDDWADADLIKLLSSEHLKKSAAANGRDFWIVAIAMFSGMRLEEVCRLRPVDDIKEEHDVPCFIIQDQKAPDWTPKTESGERVVPIHPLLINAGILRLRDERVAEERLVPNTRYSGPNKNLGVEFSRQFSALKDKLGVTEKTKFHSFRHSVSTILRNADSGIRGEWIDAVLGHEGGPRESQGISTYMKRTDILNAKRVVELIRYPESVEVAFASLV